MQMPPHVPLSRVTAQMMGGRGLMSEASAPMHTSTCHAKANKKPHSPPTLQTRPYTNPTWMHVSLALASSSSLILSRVEAVMGMRSLRSDLEST